MGLWRHELPGETASEGPSGLPPRPVPWLSAGPVWWLRSPGRERLRNFWRGGGNEVRMGKGVRQVVRRYGGSVEIRAEEGCFCVCRWTLKPREEREYEII